MGNTLQRPQPLTPQNFRDELLRVKRTKAKLSFWDQRELNKVKDKILRNVCLGNLKVITVYDYEVSLDLRMIKRELDLYNESHESFFVIKVLKAPDESFAYRERLEITMCEKIDGKFRQIDDWSRKFFEEFKQVVPQQVQRIQQHILNAAENKQPSVQFRLDIPYDDTFTQIKNHFVVIGKRGFVTVSNREDLVFDLTLLKEDQDKGSENTTTTTPPSAPSL